MTKKIIFPAMLVLVVLAVYAHTLRFDVVHLDEDDHILNRQRYLTRTDTLWDAFRRDTYYPAGRSQLYRPVQTLSFMLDARIAGTDMRWYRVVNIVLHLGAVILLWMLLKRLGYGHRASLIGAALFALHPIATRIVAWIPGRNESLFALAALGSLIMFLDAIRTPRWLRYGLHFLLFAVALAAKETALILPIAYALIYWGWNKTLSKRAWAAMGGGWAVLIALWIAGRYFALAGSEGPSVATLITGWFRNVPAFFIYLGKTIFPVWLTVLPTMRDPNLWIGIGVAVLAAAALFKYRGHISKKMIVGAVLFILFLAPTLLGIEPPQRTVFFEHRGYLSLIGVLIVFAELPWRVWVGRFWRRRYQALGLIAALAVIFNIQSARDFRDGMTFWTKAAADSPKLARAHNGLGAMEANEERWDDALAHFRQSIALDPGAKRVHNNIGIVFLRRQDAPGAQREFEQEIAVNPTYAIARSNLAFAFAAQQRLNEAETQWLASLAIDPNSIPAHHGLAIYYGISKQYDKALEHIEALYNLGATISPELQRIIMESKLQESVQ